MNILILLALLLASPLAMAEGKPQAAELTIRPGEVSEAIKAQLETVLELRLPGSMVTVKEERAPGGSLPATPFTAAAVVSSYTVTVFYSEIEPDQALQTLLLQVAKDRSAGKPVALSYGKFPGVAPKKDSFQNTINVPPFPDKIEGHLLGLDTLKSSIDESAKGLTEATSAVSTQISAMRLWLMVAVGGLTAFCLIFFIMSGRRLKGATGSISKALSSLSLGEGGSSGGFGKDELAALKEAFSGMSGAGGTGGAAGENQLPDVALKAMLFDLYHGGKDREAASLLSAVPFIQKKNLAESDPRLRAYIDFAGSLRPAAQDLLKESYYLSPLAIDQIGNETLTALVREHPALYKVLPETRINGLKLDAKERLSLEAGEGEVMDLSFLKDVPAGKARLFKKKRLITPADVSEEEALLAGGLSPDELGLLFSHALLSGLPLEQRQAILAKRDAKELASCWTGPKEILVKLEEALDEGKKKMVLAYAAKSEPQRNTVMREMITEAARSTDEGEDA